MWIEHKEMGKKWNPSLIFDKKVFHKRVSRTGCVGHNLIVIKLWASERMSADVLYAFSERVWEGMRWLLNKRLISAGGSNVAGQRPRGLLMVLIISSHHELIHHIGYFHINVIKMTLTACHSFVQKPSMTHWCLLDEVQMSQLCTYNLPWFTLKSLLSKLKSLLSKSQRMQDWGLWVTLRLPKKICWSLKPLCLRIWPYLEIRSFTDLTKLKWGHQEWTIVQYNWYPYGKGKFGHWEDTQGEDGHVLKGGKSWTDVPTDPRNSKDYQKLKRPGSILSWSHLREPGLVKTFISCSQSPEDWYNSFLLY